MPLIKSYHFNLGNSDKGPIGFCARILAASKQQAVRRLRDSLSGQIGLLGPEGQIALFDNSDQEDLARSQKLFPGLAYVHAYVNPAKITAADIDEIDAADLDDMCPEDIHTHVAGMLRARRVEQLDRMLAQLYPPNLLDRQLRALLSATRTFRRTASLAHLTRLVEEARTRWGSNWVGKDEDQ